MPKYWAKDHAYLFKDMKQDTCPQGGTYRRGHRLFSAPTEDGGRRNLPGIPFEVSLFYDPPTVQRPIRSDAKLLCEHADAAQYTFIFQAELGCEKGNVLIDSGALGAQAYIDRAFCESNSIPYVAQERIIKVGDNTVKKSAGIAVLKVKVQGYKEELQCIVTELMVGINCILSDDWLAAHKALISYDLKYMCITQDGEEVVLSAREGKSSPAPNVARDNGKDNQVPEGRPKPKTGKARTRPWMSKRVALEARLGKKFKAITQQCRPNSLRVK